MKRISLVLLATLHAACEGPAPYPTGPTPVVEVKTPTQMIVNVAGPSGWYSDRIMIDAFVLDQRGVKMPAIVRCEVGVGHLEPAQWDTATRAGSWWFETRVDAAFTCRMGPVEASYRLTKSDFELPRGCCGGVPRPPTITPAPVPGNSSSVIKEE